MVLTVVTGPPCSGKSTHIAEHRGPDALVLDLDALAHALGYPSDHVDYLTDPKLDHPARTVARNVRMQLVDQVLAYPHGFVEVWIVDSSARGYTRRRYRDAGAVLVDLDPGGGVCLERAVATHRGDGTIDAIGAWYADREQRRTTP